MARIVRRRRLVRRRRVPRKGMRRMRVNRTLNAMKDKARVVEVWSSEDLTQNDSAIQNFQLADFPRALAVSKNYRFYRATRVELEFIPYANLYAPGSAFPELYYQQDYTAFVAAQNPTLASMEGRGVLPIKWTTPIKKSYTPAVLRFEQLLVNAWKDANEFYINEIQPLTATPVKNKWYMTEKAYTPTNYVPNQTVTTYVGASADPTKLVYTGSAFFINTPVAMTGNIGRLVCRVHWEFKQPLVATHSNNVDLSGNQVIQV